MPEQTFAFAFDTGRSRAPDALYLAPHWYACHTRSRHEKKVEGLLRRQGLECYLPLVTRESRWKDRMSRVEFPLFPGYVFCRFVLDTLGRVLGTQGVATVVSARGYPTPITASEVESVRLLAQGIASSGAEPEPAPLVRRGDWVRVESGSFRGVEGVVVESRGRKRVLVGISAIGQGMEIDVALATLVPIPAPP